MGYDREIWSVSERIGYELRSLYEQYGYRKFRMGRFEEYDFYVRNKEYLAGGPYITFSDLDGKLMALKPDITLSIVKNTRATCLQPEKLYYTESVYRVSREVREYREIYQIGLECLGDAGAYTSIEMVTLALKSLSCIDTEYVLELSHMCFLSGILGPMGLSAEAEREVMACLAQKSAHSLDEAAKTYAIDEKDLAVLQAVVRLSGPIEETLQKAQALTLGEESQRALEELSALSEALQSLGIRSRVRLDFSLANDSRYYNGLMFRGYVARVPRAVLSGGRYDTLMARMGKALPAIGFAIYFDEIERYLKKPAQKAADTIILYDEQSDPCVVAQVMADCQQRGERAVAAPALPVGVSAGRVVRVLGATVKEERI